MRCIECGEVDDFEFGDGTGYCRVCGTQSQEIREEVVEFNETLFSTANKSIRLEDVLSELQNLHKACIEFNLSSKISFKVLNTY